MAHDRVEAVERALTVLDAFGVDDTALTLTELAAKTGFYKSTILRLSRSLERFGYLSRRPDGAFRLGPTLWRLGSLYRRSFDMAEHIRPVLRRLRNDTRESASFYVRDGDVRVCLYRENSTRAIRHHLDEGARLPLERGASGKVLLAFGPVPPMELNTIRDQGFAVSLGERDPEVAAVAVPVLGEADTLRGVLTISGLISHFDRSFQQSCVALLTREAGVLESRFKGHGEADSTA